MNKLEFLEKFEKRVRGIRTHHEVLRVLEDLAFERYPWYIKDERKFFDNVKGTQELVKRMMKIIRKVHDFQIRCSISDEPTPCTQCKICQRIKGHVCWHCIACNYIKVVWMK